MKAPTIPFSPATKKIVSELPWSLTSDQKKSAWEIIQDLGKPQPMHRLLQGEVGSGKTIVAGLAAFNAIQAGYQVVILAPTEILAVQHFHTLTNLFANWPIKCALLTRGHKTTNFETKSTKLKILNQLKNGEIKIIIGTHALLSDKIHFNKLGLVVIDEQHRFGVEQRQWLTKDINFTPHLLSLSATPIPRSLALTIFGDLNISIIKQMPTGRQPISTLIVPPQKRTGAYNFIRQEIKLGHRAFIICPLVEESDVLGVRAVTSEYEKLSREIFPDIKIGLLHGRLKAKDKTEIMAEFKNGTKPILISTSVVEVGVDIPEATIMMIEGAERFGIAQLHQFRGRVGRSTLKSYCLLFTDTQSEQSLKRLQALTKYQNGFDLAEFDLKKRGPGDFLGEVQSGWGKLKFAELIDLKLLDSVRAATTMTLALDATLTNFPELKNKLAELNFHPE
ncbi:MAG: ATP-dependent DNA helicase RecG [Patescibacteria group bacterium]